MCAFVPQTSNSSMKCKEEEGLDNQQVWIQQENSSLDQEDQEDPEAPRIKEEHEEISTNQGEGEQLKLKEEAESEAEQLKLSDDMWKPEINLHSTGMQSSIGLNKK